VTTVTPPSGIDHLTTFTARVEVSDADGDQVALTVWGCDFPKDTPVVLQGGAAVLSFKTAWRTCGSLVLTATDVRGASTRAQALVEHMGLGGRFRLVIGEGFYSKPYFFLDLDQSEHRVTGTIVDNHEHPGSTDPHEPGTIDEEGRFRLRFKIRSEPDDLMLAGQLIAPRKGPFADNVVGVGRVIGRRYAGRTFQLWNEAEY
jgi:hypothetical protein